jgi:hypothetical protein
MSHNAGIVHLQTGEDSPDLAGAAEDRGQEQQSSESFDNDEPLCTQPPLQYDLLD